MVQLRGSSACIPMKLWEGSPSLPVQPGNSMMHTIRSILFILLLAGIVGAARGRQAPFVPVDDPMQPFISALLLEGMGPGQNPTTWPLSQHALHDWIQGSDTGSEWAESVMERVRSRLSGRLDDDGRLHTDLRGGLRLASQDRRDLLRRQEMDDVSWQPMLLSRTWMSLGTWTASLGFRVDRYYEVDPDGMDTAHRWLSRAEDAFISRDGRFVDVFFGRMGRHWGTPGQPAFMLSDNPRPMDHVAWRIGTERLNINSVVAELDSFTGDGRMTGTAGADSVRSGSTRRMLASHRLSFAASGAWTVGLAHSTLYSGPGSGFSLKFANPFNVALWEVDNRPKNDENNGLVGAFFSYRGTRTMANGEVLFDDVDILNGNEPASLAAHAGFSRRGVLSRTNLSFFATVVTARAFNSEQAEGRYLYLGRGIGTQSSDFAHARGYLDWLQIPGWILRTGLEIVHAGEADFRGSLPPLDEKTLFTGTPETTVRPFVQLFGLMTSGVDLAFEAGWNHTSNAGHIEGESSSFITGAITLSYRIAGSRGL